MRPVIEETSTITVTGQTTVPKAVRQALGVDYGGKIAFRVEGGRVTVHNPISEHRDPALAAFLGLIEKDIAAGRNIRDLPAGLLTTMQRVLKEVDVDLNEPLERSSNRQQEPETAVRRDKVWHFMLANPDAHYGEVARALNATPKAVRYPVKYWKQVIAFLSDRGKLRNIDGYPMSRSTRSDDRLRVWDYMLSHPSARAVDVARHLEVDRGIVSFPIRYWKQVTAFLASQGKLRTR
jgi:antitoxin PrlF